MIITTLYKRLITAIVLIVFVVYGIYTLPTWAFAIVSGILALMAAWEWSNLCGVSNIILRLGYLAFFVLALLCLYMTLFQHWNSVNLIVYTLLAGFFWWFIASYWIYTYDKSARYLVESKFLRCLTGLLVLVPCWLGLNCLRIQPRGVELILFLLILVWSADSAAYFSGKYWGRHKLAPRVSPGKTIEGLFGGLLASIIIGINSELVLNIHLFQLPALILLILLTAVASVIGDLFVSVLKRQQNLKDTGQILPGHGGILDRIDSLTAAVPFFTLGYILLWH